MKDLQPRVAQPEQVSRRFRIQALNEFYYSWGPSVADMNKDGVPDIVAGPYYYLGPDYAVAREIYMAKTLDASTQYFNGVQFAPRLHRRRMAGRDQFTLYAADDPLRQPAWRIAPLGELYRDRRDQQRDRAPEGH